MKGLVYCIVTLASFLFGLHNTAFAQKRKVSPQALRDTSSAKTESIRIYVKDLLDGEALDSVAVAVSLKKGYTNKEGYAELTGLYQNAIATFSKAGYYAFSKKVKENMVIHLVARAKSAQAATVSTGFYERPVEHFSGAATVVTGNDLRKINPQSFVEALSYYDPSFQVSRRTLNGNDPNTTPAVNIRGAYNFPPSATIAPKTTFDAPVFQVNPSVADFVASQVANPNQPIFLLDGIQVSLQVALDIDINRIEKVTILKDAAATSIYGVRGGNGVVLVQTRKTQKGTLNITYSAQVQVAQADFSSYNLMNASEKLQFEEAAGLYTSNPALLQSRKAKVAAGVNTNWLEVPVNKTAFGQKHSLNLAGGSDETDYGLNFSYNDVAGTMKGSSRKNLGFEAYFGSRFNHLTVNNYLSANKTNAANSPFGNPGDYANKNAYWNSLDPSTGKFSKILDAYQNGSSSTLFYNPAYNGTLSTTNKSDYTRLSDALDVSWLIGRGFSLKAQLSYYKQFGGEDVFTPPGHTKYADFAPVDFFKRGEYYQATNEFSSIDGGMKIDYVKRSGLHQFYASLGTTMMETKGKSVGIMVNGFTSDKLSDVGFGNAYSTKKPATGEMVTRLASGFGNFTYSYNNIYQAEVSLQADGSSQFSANERINPHWSVGGSWNLHQERFFHANNLIDQFRLRASIGSTGSQNFQSYLGKTGYNYYTGQQYIPAGGGVPAVGIGLGAFMTGFGNDNLKAPQTMKQNVGIDAVFLHNRLSLRLDIYKQTTTNIVLPVTSPTSAGFLGYSYYDNLGGIESKGMEFNLNYAIIRKQQKGIQWLVSVNGIHDKSVVASTSSYIDAMNDANDASTTDQTRPQDRFVAGKSLTAIWAVRSLGIDPATGKEKFQKQDGSETFLWNAADKVVVGNWLPLWRGSFGTSFAIKNISAGIYFNYQYGSKSYNQTLADKVENADITYNEDKRALDNRWTKPGDNALYKAVSLNGLLTSPTYVTSRFVQSSNLINCSAISLGYTVPDKIAYKINARAVRLALVANNVFKAGGVQAEQGIYYPMQRLYSFSITTNF